MAYNFAPFKDRIKNIEGWLTREFTGIRTGQATPAILDSVSIESYGVRMPISQVAAVSVEDPRTLRIAPWDATQLKDIEKAITVADLGLSVRLDDTAAHVSFPQLTTDRRTMLIKLAKEKTEEARISLRKERERLLKDFGANAEESQMTEDEVKRAKNDLQKHVDEANKKFDEIRERKEKEILN